MNKRFDFLGIQIVLVIAFIIFLSAVLPTHTTAIPAPSATPGVYVQGDDLSGHATPTPPSPGGWWLAATPTTAAGAYAIISGEDRWLARDIYKQECISPTCNVLTDYDDPDYFDWSNIDDYLDKVAAPGVGRKAIIAVTFGGVANPCTKALEGYTPIWMMSDNWQHDFNPITFKGVGGVDCWRINWLDPEVKDAIDKFAQAMALKYDNDSRVEAIEIPSGAGGEALPWTHGYPDEKDGYEKKWCPDRNCSSTYCPTHSENLEMCWAYDYMNWLIDTYSDHFQSKPLIIHSEGTTSSGPRLDMAHWLLHAAEKGVGLATAGLHAQNTKGGRPDGKCAELQRDQINLTPTPDPATAKYFGSYFHFSLPFSDTIPISMEYNNPFDKEAPFIEPRQNDYWAALNALSHGADYVLAFAPSIMRIQEDYEPEFEARNTWEFVNRFAGRKASDAPAAWIAFQQTEENSKATDGSLLPRLCVERPGDYQFLLRNVGLQWGELGASNVLGYHRIADSVNHTDCKSGEAGIEPCTEYGSIDKNDKRGAFVRYLNPGAGRDAIYLDLDDAYRQRYSNEFTFKITYWDGPESTSSAFRIYYDSTGGTNYIDIPKTGQERFTTYVATVTDAKLQNSLSEVNDQQATVNYDIRIEDNDSSKDYLHMLFMQGIPSAATSTPTPVPTSTPNPNPTPDFVEDMGSSLPGSFTAYYEENDAELSFVSTPDSAWRCIEGNQQQNWPNCWAYKTLSPAQDELTVDVALQMASTRQSMTGVYYFTSAGWGILTYFDMDGFLHVMCGTALCDTEFDYITPYVFETERWYTLRVYAHKDGGKGRIAVWVKPEGDNAFLSVYTNDELSFSAGFSAFRVFSLFGINNGQWYPETTYWNDAKAWWTQHPVADAQPPSWIEPEQQLFAMSVQEQTYQHGVNGYTEGADTHIVTTNWESPTPHHTFPVLYLRTSNAEDEVKSSLVRFEGLDISAEDVISGTLSLYYSGQSVNGGSIQAHIAGVPRNWMPNQTTWLQYKTGGSWQTAGAKGIDDRWSASESKTIDYTEVGTWIEFDVTDIVRQGVNDFILYASSLGVNKDVQFPSNEYWDATKRPKLTISYVEKGVP